MVYLGLQQYGAAINNGIIIIQDLSAVTHFYARSKAAWITSSQTRVGYIKYVK